MDHKDWLVIAVFLLIILVVTDCSVGRTVYYSGVVRDHVYQHAYTTTSGTGKDATTHYHSAEYHLLLWIAEPAHAVDIDAGFQKYMRYENGAKVMVGERRGRWTNYAWLKWISNKSLPSVATNNY